MDTYTFAVSEILPDGRVIVTTYARIGNQIGVSMVVYDDVSLTTGKRVMNTSMTNGQALELRG